MFLPCYPVFVSCNLTNYAGFYEVFQMPFQGLEDDQQSEGGSELYRDTDSHELYVDPFDSRYSSSDEDEEEAEKTNSQPATPGTTLGT
ncbi:unnamed protein product, partial [Didymodactylos carnosus]